MLSVIVVAKDEARSIRACLDSVRWADEIVVFDSGSSDGTVEICREYTDHVYVTDWPGFGVQKNRALARATGDWVLSLDADERVTPELRAEIEAALSDPAGQAAFRMPRLSKFCGRDMRHSGWWPDYVVRLFRRDRARFTEDQDPHDRVVVEGAVGTFESPLRHDAIQTLEQVLAKLDSYSTAGARMLHERRVKGSVSKAVLRGTWAFLRTYVLRAGFLDGREGFILAVSNGMGTYYRYLKLMLLAERS